jgi:hypothetical protein
LLRHQNTSSFAEHVQTVATQCRSEFSSQFLAVHCSQFLAVHWVKVIGPGRLKSQAIISIAAIPDEKPILVTNVECSRSVTLTSHA